MESLFAKHSQEQHAVFQRHVEYVIRIRKVYKRLRDLATDASVKRKFEELMEYKGWKETEESQTKLEELLINLEYTGLMTKEESKNIETWHDLCAQGENRADEWLAVDDMKKLVSDDEVFVDYIPVTGPIGGESDLIPIDDAWYSVAEKRCYRRSYILQWVVTLSHTETWPNSPMTREPFTVAELFSMGADPFNRAKWAKYNPVFRKDKREDRNEIIATATNAAGTEKEGLKYLGTLGTLTLPVIDGVFRGHDGYVRSVAFSPNGTQIVSGSGDTTIRLWNVETGQKIQQFNGHTRWVHSVAFSPDGTQIVSGSRDNTIRLWNVGTGQETRQFNGHDGTVNSVAFSPDGTQIVSGSFDKTIRLWNVQTGQEIRQLNGHNRGVLSVAFSPDGAQIVSGSQDRTDRVWSVETGQEILHFSCHNRGVSSVVFSPDGTQIVSGSWDETIRLWHVPSGRLMRQLNGHNRGVLSVAFSPDGTQIVSGSEDKTIRLWNVQTGQEIRQFNGHNRGVLSVAFSPDGGQIVSGSQDRTIRLWNVRE